MSVCHTQKKCHSFLFEACGFVCETNKQYNSQCFLLPQMGWVLLPQGVGAAALSHGTTPETVHWQGDRREGQLLPDALGISKGRW